MAVSLQLAPNYAPARLAVAANDSLATVKRDSGVNAGGYREVHVQVLPSGGANPTVDIAWWSSALGQFVVEQTPITKTGMGANVPYEFTIQPKGRIFFVAVSNLSLGQVDIYCSGFGLDNLL